MSRSPSLFMDGGEEEAEICRVCRCEATDDQPLFHPCRCSGSIKYVHEDCLKEWLSRSGKRHCELCKFQFSFTRVYREDMPETIPLTLLIRCGLERIFHSITFGLRIILASTVWLIVLPYITVWSLRTLLWSGENVALGLSGAQLPLHIVQMRANQSTSSLVNATYNGPNGLWYALIDAAMYGIRQADSKNITAFNTTLDADASTVPVQGIDERQLLLVISRFFADCFEGQIIACLVVVIFVAGFLLREWILQNTPPVELQMLADVDAPVAPAPIQQPPLPPVQPLANRVEHHELPARNPVGDIYIEPRPIIGHHTNGESSSAAAASASTAKRLETSSRKSAMLTQRQSNAKQFYAPCGRYRIVSNRRYRYSRSVQLLKSNQLDKESNAIQWRAVNQSMKMTDNSKVSKARIVVWLKPFQKGNKTRVSHFTFEETNQPTSVVAWPVHHTRHIGKAWTADIHWSVARRSPKRISIARYCRQCQRPHMKSMRYLVGLRRDWSINLYPNTTTSTSIDDVTSQLAATNFNGSMNEDQPNDDISSQTASTMTRLTEETEQPRTFEEELDELSKQTEDPSLPSASNSQLHNNVNIEEYINHSQIDGSHPSFDATEQIVPDVVEEASSSSSAAAAHDDIDTDQAITPVMEGEPLVDDQQEPDVDNIAVAAQPEEHPIPRVDEVDQVEVQAEEHMNNILPRFFRQVQAWVAERLDDDDEDDDDEEEEEEEDNNNNDELAGEIQNDNNDNNPADQLAANQPAAPLRDNNNNNNNNNNDNNAFINQFGAEFDPQFNEMAGEEFDGVLEAMGIRGPVGLLFQNAALMTILVMLALACAAWMPYIVGKTFVLMSPLDYITLPLRVLRLITDPVVDFTLDVWLPLCWRICLFLLRPITTVFGLSFQLFMSIIYYSSEVWLKLLSIITDNNSIFPMDSVFIQSIHKQAMEQLVRFNELFDIIIHELRQQIEYGIEAFTQHAIKMDQTLHHDLISASGTITTDGTTNTGVGSYSMMGATANATFSMAGWLLAGDPQHETVVKLQERWQSFAYGNTPADHFLSVAIGYMVIGFDLVLYLAYTRNAYGHAVGNAMQQGFLMAALVVKVIFFVIIELIVFPTTCGILLDLVTLPLFPNTTLFTRIEFQLDAPFTSVFLHWFVGTGFMYFFSSFIILCRKIVRPGVMWFIRDPNDPRFHPMKEILERTAWVQLRRVAASGLMYIGIILVCFGGTIYGVQRYTTGILPLKWSIDKPISDFPIDLLVLHLVVPMLVTWARPKRHLRTYFTYWWRMASRLLRLSSFMFGGRYVDEEITRTQADNDNTTVLVGRRVLAPSYDGIPAWLERSVFIPVNEAGEPIHPEDRAIIEDDSVPTEQRGIVIYLPSYFRTRIGLFLVLMWLTGTIVGLTLTIGPLLIGRFLCEQWITHRAEHDVYTFFVGISLISMVIGVIDMLKRSYQFAKRIHRMRWRRTIRLLLRYIYLMVQITTLIVIFGIVIPYLMAIVVKRCLLLPLFTLHDKRNLLIISLQDWALGILYCKVAIQVALLFPENVISRSVTRVLTGNVARWNTWNALIYFALPIITLIGVFLTIPYMVGPIILKLFNYWGIGGEIVEKQFYLLAYPVEMLTLLGVSVYYFGRIIIQRWVANVFEEEFLVGERLHNYADINAAAQTSSPTATTST